MEPRARRAVAAAGLALAAVVVVGAIYQRPQQVPATTAPRTPTPRRLTMVDPGHGWALGFRPGLPAFSAELRSDDGGRDWTPITIPA